MADCPGTRAISKQAVSGRITLRNVGFAYPGTTRQVLHEMNLDVEPGETIALVGRSGSGKTTLCNLIARFYDPTTGGIALDGADLREIEVESYRRLLGIVEQDVFLFDGTIAENIAYGHRWATRARIEQAARAANAAEFIERLSDGYDTLIGERGVRLSGGQRQRLAIARAVLADPKIFILDEATSNLDSESERLIQQSLEQLLLGRTSFVIAHRLSTIRHADRILVLDDGKIVEAGSHTELMGAQQPVPRYGRAAADRTRRGIKLIASPLGNHHLHPMRRSQRHRWQGHNTRVIRQPQPIFLCHRRQNERRFHQREIIANADPGPAAKRKVSVTMQLLREASSHRSGRNSSGSSNQRMSRWITHCGMKNVVPAGMT